MRKQSSNNVSNKRDDVRTDTDNFERRHSQSIHHRDHRRQYRRPSTIISVGVVDEQGGVLTTAHVPIATVCARVMLITLVA